LHVAKTGTIKELIDALIQKAQISSEEEGGKIRIYETSSNRFYREPLRDHPVANLNDFTQIYAERVPQEELEAPEDSRFAHVFHFQTDVSRVHGVPFKFLLIEVGLRVPANFQSLIFV
jgi:ubiquitin carboxyl-terminal hydrolase 7